MLHVNPPLRISQGFGGTTLDFEGPDVQLVRIVSQSGNLYLAQRQSVEPNASPPSLSDVEPVWVVSPPGQSPPAAGAYYHGWYAGVTLGATNGALRLFIVTPGSGFEFVRLDGNPGSTCTYLNGYIQVFDTSGPCIRVSDGEQVDVLDLNQP